MNEYTYEKLSDNISVCVSENHRFGTDAFLLSNFSQAKNKDKVCDLGTGCGIIPFIIKRDYNPSLIYGVDIQKQAIEQFKIGVEKSNLLNEVIPIEMDLKDVMGLRQIIKKEVDLVTCNPPYKINNSGIVNKELPSTIARHEVLCNIDDVCKTASALLKFGGRFCICQRPQRLADVITSMKNANIEPKRLQLVCKTKSSAPWLFLLEGKKGSKPYMSILENFFVYDDETMEYSKVMKEIYGIND